MSGDMLRIPITATMRVVDGESQMIEAEWADVPVEAFINLLRPLFPGALTEKPTEQQTVER